MKDADPRQPIPQTGTIAIQEIIQIRVLLGNEEQVPTSATTEILTKLDSVILHFTNGLNKGN